MKNLFSEIYQSEKFKNAIKLPLREFPFIVDIEPTNNCNISCKMCSRNVMARKCGYMEFDVFKKVIDECSKYKTPVRMIRWGEPLLNTQIFDFIHYAKSKNVLLHMTSNALLLDIEKAEKILESGLDSLIFSMQGATKERYEKMRNNDKYDIFEKNIIYLMKRRKDLCKEKPFVHISSTMTDETDEEINNFINKWENIVDSVGVGKTTFAQVDKEGYREQIVEYLPKETIKRIYSPCREVYQKLSVDWNGDVTACCADFDGLMKIGNVKEVSLKEIWDCEKLNKYRELLGNMQMDKLPLCKDCYHTYEDI